jgi:uncharacterized repeat protein (TIGR01451 family)/fimbrial isopeptide formation D2 family protein
MGTGHEDSFWRASRQSNALNAVLQDLDAQDFGGAYHRPYAAALRFSRENHSPIQAHSRRRDGANRVSGEEIMLRTPRILTRAKDKRQVVLSLNLTQRIILTLLVAALATVPLWLDLARVHSAPSKVASPAAFTAIPEVKLESVPTEALIGEQFKFKVTFDNVGTDVGYGPFIDVVLPAGGMDLDSFLPSTTTHGPCDGISTNLDGMMVSVNGGPLPVTTYKSLTTPCGGPPNTVTHPFSASGVSPVVVPAGGQLITLELPFGSFEPDQPKIEVEITVDLHKYADVGPTGKLTIFARGGFHFGITPLNDYSGDQPIVTDSSGPSYDNGTTPSISSTWVEKKDVIPTVFKLKKVADAPEDETATGPNFLRKYTITADIADGQKIDNLKVQDFLPNNVQYQGQVIVKIGTSTATVGTSCPGVDYRLTQEPPTTAPQNSPTNELEVSFCNTIIGTTAAADVTVTFTFFVPEKDANPPNNPVLPTNCKPATSVNDVKAEGNWTPADPRDLPMLHISSDLTLQDHILADKCIAIQKSLAMAIDTGAPGLTPNDTLLYTLTFQISDYKTIGNLVVDDFLSNGQTLVSPVTLTVSDQFGTKSGTIPAPFISQAADPQGAVNFCPAALQQPLNGTVLTFNISAAMAVMPAFGAPRLTAGILTGGYAAGSTPPHNPAIGTITFRAQVGDVFQLPVSPGDQFVDKDDPMNNCVRISGKVLQNRNRPFPINLPINIPYVVSAGANDDSATHASIIADTLEKKVRAVMRGNNFICGPNGPPCSNLPNPPQEVRPGDQVTFSLEKTVFSSDAEQLTIEDWLPLPIFSVAAMTFNNGPCVIPAANTACLGPGDQMLALVGPTKPSFFASPATNSIKFDYGPNFNDPANQPRTIEILFTSTVTNQPFADGLYLTNEAQECENNTFSAVKICQAAIAQVKMREPKLQLTKGVVATDNPHGVFTPALSPTGVWKPYGSSCPDFQNGPITSTSLGGLINSNLSNVDANDQVTFGIAIENTGGAPACEIELADIIPLDPLDKPSCFDPDYSSLCITDGNGAPIPFTTAIGGHGRKIIKLAPGFCLAPGSPANTTGTNIAIITFNAQLHSDITPGCCDNVAQLLHYTSQLGGPDFVGAGFTPPFTDAATLCVNPTLTKSLVSTSEPHTTGSNVTIGEIARYRLEMILPEGGVLPNFQVTDALPAGMKFLNDGSARIAFVSNGGITRTALLNTSYNVNGNAPPSSAALTALLPIPTGVISVTSNCGDDPIFNLLNVQNNDNDPDLEYIVIEFNALVCNEASNLNGATLPNTFNVSVGGNQIATSNPVNVIIVEPNLTMTKTVAPNPAVKGQTLTYTVQYTNNGTADAFNVELKDTLPPGLTLGTVAAGCPFTNLPLNTLTVTCAQIPKAPNPGSTVIVTYQAVANPATCPVTLKNQANLTWTSLPGPQGTTVNPTGSSTPGNSGAVDGERDGVTPVLTLNDYAAPASAAVKIDCPCEAMVTGLKFNDLNGNGVRDPGEPGLANWTIQVTDSNGITHTTTTDSAGNYSITVPAPGTYTVAEVLQSGWTQTAPTSGTYSVTVSPGQVVTNLNFGNRKKQKECDLQVTKEVKPSPLVSGQQATATIIVKNVGTAPCHGPTQVAESMPAGLTPISATVPGGSCVLSTGICNYAPAILAGGSVVFTYVFNVTAQPGTSFENCAKLKNSEDTNPTNNSTCVPLTVSDAKLPDLTIKKTVQCGGPAIPQGTCNVTLTIGNNGPGAFNGILVIQDLVTPPPSPALSLIGSSPGWSCTTGPPNNISCATTSSASLASGQSTTLSLSVKIPGGQYKNCASVKGYTQSPYNSSTLIQEGDLNNNESCVSMNVSGDCPTVPLRLFSTGVADNGSLLSSGATDPHYVLLNTSPVFPNAFVLSANQIVGYVANSATSQWLGPDPPGANGGQGGFYTYRTTFNLDCDPSTAVISGQWSTDNEAEIFLNGSTTGVTTGASAFGAFTPFVINSGFVSGVNTLDFRVRNRLSSQGARTPTGLQVQMNGTVKCCSSTGSLTVTKTVENLSPSPIPAGTSFLITVSCLPSGILKLRQALQVVDRDFALPYGWASDTKLRARLRCNGA